MWDNVGTRGDKAAARVLAGGIIMAHEATELQSIQNDGINMAHEATELQPRYWRVGYLYHMKQHSCSPGTSRWDNYGTRGNKAASQLLAGGIIMTHKATDLQPGYWRVGSLGR